MKDRSVQTKECSDEDCSNTFIQYRSFDKYCSLKCKEKNSKSTKKKSYIQPISKKRLAELALYREVRDAYRLRFPYCEVCGENATEVHHKNGRTNDRLYDDKYFLSVCRPCHVKLHLNPKESREKGYLI